MPSFEIKHHKTTGVLFRLKCWCMKTCVETAAKRGVDLTGADLRAVDLYNAHLDGAKLTDAKLAGTNLNRARLNGANLSGADLRAAMLRDAYLRGVNASGTNLHLAKLHGSDWHKADLSGADLTDSNLDDANLRGANLADVKLAGAKYGEGIPMTQEPVQVTGLSLPVMILDQHMKIRNELHSLADWASFDHGRIVLMDGSREYPGKPIHTKFWVAYGDVLLTLAESAGRPIIAVEPVNTEESQ